MADLVGVSELARQLNVGKGTLSKQAASGKIPIAKRDENGHPLFDIEAVKAAREGNLNPLMRREVASEGNVAGDVMAGGEPDDEDEAPERRSGAPRPPSQLVEQQKLEKQLKNRRLFRQLADDEGLLVLKSIAAEDAMTLARRTRDGVTALMTDQASTLYAFIGQQPRTEAELRVWLQEHTAQAFNETAQGIAAEDGDEFDDDRADDVEQSSSEPVAAAAA